MVLEDTGDDVDELTGRTGRADLLRIYHDKFKKAGIMPLPELLSLLTEGKALRTTPPIAIVKSHDRFEKEVAGFKAFDLADLAYKLMVKGIDVDAEALRTKLTAVNPAVANSPLYLFSDQVNFKPVSDVLVTLANKASHRPVLYVPNRFALDKPIKAVHPNYFFVRDGRYTEVRGVIAHALGKK